MMKTHLTVVAAVISCHLVFTVGFGMSGNVKSIPNRKITSTKRIWVIENTNLVLCADRCVYETGCLSVSFNRVFRTCELYSVNSSSADPVNIEVENDTVLVDIETWPAGRTGACASKPCGANSTCVKNGETFDCKGFRKPGCRKIITPEHGYVVGEISGTTQPFGHKVYVGCVWPYVSLWLRYDHHAMSVCLQTGAWSWPTENCYRVTDVCYFFNDETQASGLMDFVSHTDLAGETTFNNWPGWRPGPVSDRPWLKMTFQGTYWVGGISTRGHPATSEWVETYKLAYNIDEGCGSWNYYNEQPANTVTKIFEANTDGVTWKENLLEPPVKAKCFRFEPLTAHNRVAMFLIIRRCTDPRIRLL